MQESGLYIELPKFCALGDFSFRWTHAVVNLAMTVADCQCSLIYIV